MSEFKETRPAKLPRAFPKASDLVDKLMNDVLAVTLILSDDATRRLKDKFHTTVRRHRHEQERFGKKWKKRVARIENTNPE